MSRGPRWWLAGVVCVFGVVSSAHAAPRKTPTLGMLIDRVQSAEASVIAVERAVVDEPRPTEAWLAERVVAAQLALEQGTFEQAAMISLDLVEHHADTPAGIEATYLLGRAATHLEMERWAVELFSSLLSREEPQARRLHQLAVAELFELAIPPREPGFARRPGLAALPETQARLAQVGVSTTLALPDGWVSEDDAQRLLRWAESFPEQERVAPLRYAWGRYLYLSGATGAARDQMDALILFDPVWHIKAAYVAAACSAALGDNDDALRRFEGVTTMMPRSKEDQTIVELAWMGIGRLHHDAGQPEFALQAYRMIGRDSAMFAEALYESAWTLLDTGQFELAEHALDLMIDHAPLDQLTEIRQLRGKVKMQARNYTAAEEEFLALRREFETLGHQLGGALDLGGDAEGYFAAVVGEDMAEFSLSSVLPGQAAPVAMGLTEAVVGEQLIRSTGRLEQEIEALDELAIRIELALAVPEPARLFNGLGAHLAGLDNVLVEVVDVQEALVALAQIDESRQFEDRLKKLHRLRTKVADRVQQAGGAVTLSEVEDTLVASEDELARVRAQAVAIERGVFVRHENAAGNDKFYAVAAELRRELGALQTSRRRLAAQTETAVLVERFADRKRIASNQALADYRVRLGKLYERVGRRTPDMDAVWQQVDSVWDRALTARHALDEVASVRLAEARQILVEEQQNLREYEAEIAGLRGDVEEVGGQLVGAVYYDVVAEVYNLMMRSEVGLLDVAWGMKEAEAEEVKRLIRIRDRDLATIDESIAAAEAALEHGR